MITDYCRGDQEQSKKFKDYVKQRGYNLLTVKVSEAKMEFLSRGNVTMFLPTKQPFPVSNQS